MIYPRETQDASGVARHYDELTEYYLEIWGEHIHHGLWLTGAETPDEAVRQLVEVAAERTGITEGRRVCDVGCGYGATARLLVREYEAHVVGVTISQAQFEYARAQVTANGNPRFLLRDWLANDLPSAAFDVVLSIESSEHMVDKTAFFNEAHRVLRPGGCFGVYAWLAKADPRDWEIAHLLEPICREGRLPSLGNEMDYRSLLLDSGFEAVDFEDFSAQVRKTWSICAWRMIRLAVTNGRARRFLLRGPENRVFAKTVLRMWLAYRLHSLCYGLFTARKPSSY
jgi:tocopherol O-methyltransferase